MTNFILLLFSLARKNTWECPPQILGVYLPGGLQSVESNKKKKIHQFTEILKSKSKNSL